MTSDDFASREDCLKIENNRTIENLNTIYLFKSNGNSEWYSAYELSAYLLEFYPNNLEKPLKPVRTKKKGSDETVVKVGFPFTSFEKYVPNFDIKNISGPMVEIKVDGNNDITIDNYKNKLEWWKNDIKISITGKDNKKNSLNRPNQTNNNIGTIFNKPTTFLNIMSSILSYDTHAKTEEELRHFIISTKEKCASMIC